ncbi:MAG: ubiquinol-cytochrome c reductase iron-sulfur subunit [Planctomycetota bacterium]
MASDKAPLYGRRGIVQALLGFGAVGSAALAAGLGVLRNLFPSVSYGEDTRVRIGRQTDFADGETVLYDRKLVVRKVAEGGKVRVAAISMVCTHLGCTVGAITGGFKCPCHGSQFDGDGRVMGGPASRDLDWFTVTPDPAGELVVDKSKTCRVESYFEA